jgi:hypothetical protein
VASRTTSDFAHFYTTSLLHDLKELDKLRQRVLGRVKVLLSVTAGILLAVVALCRVLGAGWGPVLILGFLCLSAASSVYRYLVAGYANRFKLKVIKRIVEFLDPGLAYQPGGHISKAQFHSSRIFERYPDRMEGDDLVRGKLGITNVEFSEVHAWYKGEPTGRHGTGQRKHHSIFKGIFFVADFNKVLYGKTVVLPDTAERVLGGIGSLLQSLNRSRGELIRMDHPEFEKFFVVYGDDQIESRYVLSTSLMQRILDFRKKTGKKLYLSFVGSQVFVAIPYRRSLFEPKVLSGITGFKGVRQYFDDLQLALGIVDDLNLNMRIWAQQATV